MAVGIHWLLPTQFGNDYRKDPRMMHTTGSGVRARERGHERGREQDQEWGLEEGGGARDERVGDDVHVHEVA